MTKYTREKLEAAIIDSKSWADVCRYFGVKTQGGTQAHIKSRAELFKIDYSHFLGRAWSKDKKLPGKQKLASEILILRKSGNRQHAYMLRRSLIELGVKHSCSICSLSEWNNKNIILEIDHKNGDWLDDRYENLRFLCPNCHSQTDNYKNKSRCKKSGG